MTQEEVDQLVAANVRSARARLRMTQQELSDELDWARATVGALENGTRRVTLADALALCAALKLDLKELLRGAPAEALQTFGLE
jgi:transcriptional regulator with XRE-family HTH domain